MKDPFIPHSATWLFMLWRLKDAHYDLLSICHNSLQCDSVTSQFISSKIFMIYHEYIHVYIHMVPLLWRSNAVHVGVGFISIRLLLSVKHPCFICSQAWFIRSNLYKVRSVISEILTKDAPLLTRAIESPLWVQESVLYSAFFIVRHYVILCINSLRPYYRYVPCVKRHLIGLSKLFAFVILLTLDLKRSSISKFCVQHHKQKDKKMKRPIACCTIMGQPLNSHNPSGTWRNNNAIITSKRPSRRRFDVIMTLILRHVSVGQKASLTFSWFWMGKLSGYGCPMCVLWIKFDCFIPRAWRTKSWYAI